MNKPLSRFLPVLAVVTVIFPGAALAGHSIAAGTLLSEGGFGKSEAIGLLVGAFVAVVVVIYLKRRKSK